VLYWGMLFRFRVEYLFNGERNTQEVWAESISGAWYEAYKMAEPGEVVLSVWRSR
jgi:hypothetical protein